MNTALSALMDEIEVYCPVEESRISLRETFINLVEGKSSVEKLDHFLEKELSSNGRTKEEKICIQWYRKQIEVFITPSHEIDTQPTNNDRREQSRLQHR
jgi:hypothetical protein